MDAVIRCIIENETLIAEGTVQRHRRSAKAPAMFSENKIKTVDLAINHVSFIANSCSQKGTNPLSDSILMLV